MLPLIAVILFWLSLRSEDLQVGMLRRGAAVGVVLLCTILTAEKLF
jgi:hypothetical protein